MRLICYKACIGKTVDGTKVQVSCGDNVYFVRRARKLYHFSLRGALVLLTKQQLINNFAEGIILTKKDVIQLEKKENDNSIVKQSNILLQLIRSSSYSVIETDVVDIYIETIRNNPNRVMKLYEVVNISDGATPDWWINEMNKVINNETQ